MGKNAVVHYPVCRVGQLGSTQERSAAETRCESLRIQPRLSGRRRAIDHAGGTPVTCFVGRISIL